MTFEHEPERVVLGAVLAVEDRVPRHPQEATRPGSSPPRPLARPESGGRLPVYDAEPVW